MKTELRIFIHHNGVLSKKQIQGYIRDAVTGWMKGYHRLDARRSIKKITFRPSPSNAKSELSTTKERK